MRLIFNPIYFQSYRLPLFLAAFFYSLVLPAQNCSTPKNFEAVFYDHSKAAYEWDYAADANSYVLAIEINNKSYTKTDLPGSATAASIKFAPLLQHNDRVHALLTKHCDGGEEKTVSFDFIIIDDAIVYLTGTVLQNLPNTVEPVQAINDNIVPAHNICGRCDPGFFRLEAGFYGTYSIAVDPSIGPIEQLRFLKNELCDCLDDAIDAGILDENGGPGEHYNGKPFHCDVTPYVFVKEDCIRRSPGEPGQERDVLPTNVNTALHLEVIPNPTAGITQLTYQQSRETNTTLSIYDVTGRLVHQLVHLPSETAGVYRFEFDAGAWTPGFYYCQLQANGSYQTTVLVVAR